jgi:hypothetical protein
MEDKDAELEERLQEWLPSLEEIEEKWSKNADYSELLCIQSRISSGLIKLSQMTHDLATEIHNNTACSPDLGSMVDAANAWLLMAHRHVDDDKMWDYNLRGIPS